MWLGLLLAGASGWAGDDICPPPRPWPWPWLWRKLVAILGGVGSYYLFIGRFGAELDIPSTVLVGLVGGIALPSLIGLAGGGRAGPSN